MQRNVSPLISNLLFSLRKGYKSLPRKHTILTICLSLSLVALISTGERKSSDHVPGEREKIPLTLEPLAETDQGSTTRASNTRTLQPLTHRTPPTVEIAALARAVGDTQPASTAPEKTPTDATASINWQTVKVRPGDSLSRLFQRVGLNDRALHLIMENNEQAAELSKIYPGEELSFHIDNGVLQALRHIKSPLERLLITRENDRYQANKTLRQPEIRERFSHAIIDDNLFKAGDRANLSHGVIMELANVFSGVIDFVYDPRRGDAFSVLYEELYLDGEKYQDGRILAAYFTNQGTEYPAFSYIDPQGNRGYYNEDGVSMRKAFLRSPVDFTRISSQFNPARLHPIFKTKRPHRGIDYAAKRGTPVFATGDGRVTRAGYTRANGNYLVIAHGEQFITKYLHLHKKQVKKGQRVRQGQIIGQVGSTGYATGPHLHYEFLLNGVHRNPRTIHRKLPKARSIPRSERSRFETAIAPLQARINEYHQTQLLAARSASAAASR